MMKYFVIGLVLISTISYGQKYTINSVETDSVFVGINNVLEIEGFTRNDKISVKSSRNIRIRKSGRHSFFLIVSRPFEKEIIEILKGEEIIDTIQISSYRTKLDQFIRTDNYRLIRSGEYPLEVLKQIKSIEVKINVPWINKIQVQKYLIEIFDEKDKLIFSKTIYKENFNDEEIENALSKLKRGEEIRIRNIKARTPYDDGERPNNFKLIAK